MNGLDLQQSEMMQSCSDFIDDSSMSMQTNSDRDVKFNTPRGAMAKKKSSTFVSKDEGVETAAEGNRGGGLLKKKESDFGEGQNKDKYDRTKLIK